MKNQKQITEGNNKEAQKYTERRWRNTDGTKAHRERRGTQRGRGYPFVTAFGCCAILILIREVLQQKVIVVAAYTALLAGCNRGRHHVLEIDYISAPQVILRDQLSQVYNKVGAAKNGDRVDVLDREKRFPRSAPRAGWRRLGRAALYLVTSSRSSTAFQKMQQQREGLAGGGNSHHPQ